MSVIRERWLAGKCVKRRLLQVFRHQVVKPLFLLRGNEFLHQGVTVGVVDVFKHLLAERPLANRPKPFFQVVEIIVVSPAA